MEEDELDQEATERWKRHPMTVKMRRNMEKDRILLVKGLDAACARTADADVRALHTALGGANAMIEELGGES